MNRKDDDVWEFWAIGASIALAVLMIAIYAATR